MDNDNEIEYHECGGCGRINSVGDYVCLCDMDTFQRERPDEYADMVSDGLINQTQQPTGGTE